MNTEFTYLLVAVLSLALSASWVVGVTFYAHHVIKDTKKELEYYQKPETQAKIAQHVIKNQWFKNGGEVFR